MVREARGEKFGDGTSRILLDESFRVCINGTERVCIRGSAWEPRLLLGSEVSIAALIEDLFRLCRDVRLSSKGFMSGGNLEIFRKMTVR